MSTTSSFKPGPSLKYETFVEKQLARASWRVRALDLTAAGLGLLLATLAYGLVVALLDRWLLLPAFVRQAAFSIYVLGAATYLAITVVRPLCQNVNPYYAARQVEHVLPAAKNSVVNWLDLRNRPLPAAIRGAVIHRAAKDLARADLDQAISARRSGWLGGLALGAFIGLFILFIQGRPQFFSLMGRAFAPFVESSLATRTQLTVVQPEGGNCTVAVGRSVSFTVHVEGRVPEANQADSMRLLFRYQLTAPFEERPLQRGESSGEWVLTLAASEVQNGLWYKAAGGDAETPEYRVQVRSTPLFTDFEASYHFRPYLHRADESSHDPNLEGIRGTDVTLVARTNRKIREGHLDLESSDGDVASVPGELVAEDPQALRFKLVLVADRTYRVWFVSVEGERNTDPMPYTIRVRPDLPPQVELTKPGRDITLPANGILRLEGTASDDFGVTAMTLRILYGTKRPSIPYRSGKSFRLEGGNYPLKLDYKQFVELEKIDGAPLKPGTLLEYWLEAVDNCDYPKPGDNVGKSQVYKVLIGEPSTEAQQQARERQEAQNDQAQHEAAQDKELNKEQEEKPDPDKNQTQKSEKDQKAEGDNDQKIEDQADKLNKAINENEKQQQGSKGEKNQEKGNSQPNDSKDTKDGTSKSGSGDDGKPDSSQGNGNSKESKADSKGPQDKEKNNDAKGAEGSQKGDSSGNGQSNKDNSEKSQGAHDKSKDSQSKDGKNGSSASQGNQGDNADQKNPRQGSKNGDASSGSKGDRAEGKKDKGQDAAGKPGQSGTEGSGQKQGSGSAQPQGKPENGDQGQEQAGSGDAQKQRNGQEAERGNSGQTDSRRDKENGGQKNDGKEKGAGQPDKQEMKSASDKGDAQTKQEKGDQKPGSSSQEGGATKDNPADKQGQKGPDAKGEKSGSGQAQEGQPKGDKQSGDAKQPAGADKDAARHRESGGTEQKSEKDAKSNQGASKEDQAGSQKNEKGAGGDSKEGAGQDRGQDKEKGAGRSGDRGDQPPTERGTIDQKNEAQVRDLIKKIENGDAKVRRDAARDLKDKMQDVTDPSLRKAIEDALQKNGDIDKAGTAGDRSGSNKSGQKGEGDKGDQGGTPTGEKGNPSDRAGQNKGDSRPDSGQPGGNDPASKGSANPSSGGKNGTANSTDQDRSDQGSQKRDPNQPINVPRDGTGTGDGGHRTGPAVDSNAQPGKESPADARYQKKAGVMQLEDIRKKVTPEVLKKAGFTVDDYRQFLKQYPDWLKRKHPESADPDKLANPKDRGGALNNRGSRQVESKANAKEDSLQHGTPGQAPPEFREAYRQFTQKLSDIEKRPDKK